VNKLITFALTAGLSLTAVGCTVLQTPAPPNPNMPDNVYIVGYPEYGYSNFGHRSEGRGVRVGYPPGRETRPLDPRDVMSRGQYPDGTKYWSTDPPPRKKGGNKKHR
jgi:hypothetical protein